MRRACLCLAVLMAGLASVSAQSSTQGKAPPTSVADQLIKLDLQLARAAEKGDTATIDRILAADYVTLDSAGNRIAKTTSLERSKLAHRGAIKNADYNVRVFGTTAVMTHRSTETVDGKTEESVITHVWVSRAGKWQIVSDQYTSVHNGAVGEVPGCKEASMFPEVLQFFGDAGTVFKKLESDDMTVQARRVYFVLVETTSSAEISMYEKQSAHENTARVYTWAGKTAGSLRDKLADMILLNRGIACVGEMAKRTILESFDVTVHAGVPAPASVRGAFGHVVKAHGNEYVRVTVFLLC